MQIRHYTFYSMILQVFLYVLTQLTVGIPSQMPKGKNGT